METNQLRDRLVKELSAYYDKVGVNPHHFHCPNKDKCPGENLARGMECHIGRKYGMKKKILVSSLDCGYSGHSTINERTKDVEHQHNDTIHIRTTLKCVMKLLELNSPDDAVDYMVLTNACKCCNGSSKHLSWKYYEQCKEYKIAEYQFLKPDVILFQGKRDLSLRGCEKYLTPTDIDFLYIYDDGVIKCYGIECIHPSARGKHAQRRKWFYDERFPQIVDYIKEQWRKER